MSAIREALEAAQAEMQGNEPEKEIETPQEPTEEPETEVELEGEEPEEQQAQPKTDLPKQEAKQTKQQSAGAEKPIPEQHQDAVEAPTFWKAEHRDVFKSLPPAAQKVVAEYEQQRNLWANRLTSEVGQVRHFQKQFEQVVEPHLSRLKASMIDPIQAVDKLLRWSDILDDDSTRIQGFNKLLASYGLTPQHLVGQEQEQIDPVYSQVNTELSELKKWKEDFTQQQQHAAQEREQQALISDIEAVKGEKDQSGALRHPRLDLYSPQMAQIIPQLKQTNPFANRADLIKEAYRQVDQMFVSQFGVQQQPQMQQQAISQKAIEDKQRAERAQKAASMNVSSKPSVEVQSRPKNVREALRESWAELA